jgi:PEP-CTERM motif
MKVRLLAATLAASLVVGAAQATVYELTGQDLPVGGPNVHPATATGTITTNGALGVLSQADIVSADITVTDPFASAVLTGPIVVIGSALTATASGLFFNYSAGDNNGFGVNDSGFDSSYCVATNPSCIGDHGPPTDFELVIVQGDFHIGPTLTDDVQIATAIPAAPIPEPATWAMMLAGFAGLGYAGYRRLRSVVTAV